MVSFRSAIRNRKLVVVRSALLRAMSFVGEMV
jgi:hypothetical protein